VVDEQGVNKGSVTRKMSIPLLAAITHPIICIEDGTIDFELEVSQSEASSSSTEAEPPWKRPSAGAFSKRK
jgi:hypothetical protein